ncbi:hypothetical protein [Olivibacter domesticus]|uniref:MetA-pathway of phenol degradation n=1 Tax=Olivibacter domesticus TaxID=407022 RepID=A0A1H7QZF5_OLID1|nr:hypothetical protein [Olivibacter domesticus]SEL53323.1 hypothetical protein SAMN05661044_02780 [Olivibacter domesticus]
MSDLIILFRYLVSIFSLACLYTVVAAQDTTEQKKSFFDRVELRQSFNTPDGKNAPVQFQMTFPKNKDHSFLIDGGIAYSLEQWGDGKIFGEYHRNTLVEKEQHNWQAGFASVWYAKAKRNQAGTTINRWFFSPTLKYIMDKVDTVHSLALNVDALPFRSGEKGLNLATNTLSSNKRLIHFALLSGGTEIQQNFSAKNDGEKGFILRPTLKVQYSLAGNKRRDLMTEPIKTWAFTFNYDQWYDLINTTDYEENYTHFFRGGFDYFFLTAAENSTNMDLSVGVSFNYGSKPQQALDQQQFWLFTINIQK